MSDVFVAIHAGQATASALPAQTAAAIEAQWKAARTTGKAGETRTFYGVGGEDRLVVAVGMGAAPVVKSEATENKLKEMTRRSAALGTLALKAASSKAFEIDPGHSAHAAAVGANLASFAWNLKTTSAAKEALVQPTISLLAGASSKSTLESEKASGGIRNELSWDTGLVYARAQNLARELMELPANVMTPTIFTERATKELEGIANVEVLVHGLDWALEKKMGSFISVSRGSAQPLKFLEVHYRGAANKDDAPLALVGKGITFDSGGISIKGAAGMKDMRADMGGAATTFSAFWAIATMQLKVNVDLFIPLTENLIGPEATKPGDIVIAGNGVTIEVDNTDAEGRLVLADALYYATSAFKPHTVINAATLTGAMMIALGNQYTGVFTNSDSLFKELDAAGQAERDPVWRMPLDEGYYSQINKTGMDLCNTGGRLAGACTAAIFLKRFVNGLIVDGADNEDQSNLIRWAHMDIAGVMDLASSDGYNRAGMTGRPVRTIIEFVRRSADAK